MKTTKWNRVITLQNFCHLERVRVFGIARVSTDKQAMKHGESLDYQAEVIESWVESRAKDYAPQEWKLVEVYTENQTEKGIRRGRTATTREGRLGLEKALDFAQVGLIDVTVVTKLDRIARNIRDYLDIFEEFNKCHVALVCLDLDIDVSTPDGQMIMRNHASLAQWHSERTSQYSLETAKRHVRQGRPLGSAPIGYKAGSEKWYPF